MAGPRSEGWLRDHDGVMSTRPGKRGRAIAGQQISGDVTLHRKRYRGEEDGWVSPEPWVGRATRFRHDTLTPDGLHDVLFAEAGKGAGS